MNPKLLLTFILALSAHVIAIEAENPKDLNVESPTHGTTFSLSASKGKLVALHFLLKTECPFCLKLISDDGRFMLFQDGRGGMESGQGFSIYLYDFGKAP